MAQLRRASGSIERIVGAQYIPRVIVVAVVLAVVLSAAAWALVSYNRFVRQRQLIDNAWSNVDTELKRRYDLIPNLVATVKGYAGHERDTLEAVVEARARAVAETGSARAQAGQENVLVDALKHLLALRESYPELKANTQFLDLQAQLVTTEDRIQAARRLYNANVRDFNTRVQSFPSTLVARAGGFAQAEFFELEPAIRDAGAPEVKL
jgi:LemA protein